MVVATGVDMRLEANVASEHAHRNLSDSIKICAPGNDVHFIQFVTRLTPDEYEYRRSKGQIQQWDTDMSEVEPHYMRNADEPRWKVDTTPESTSCFYDDAGVCARSDTQTAMYDCPGGPAEPIAERVIFCTFVIINNHVTHKIKWSKQFGADEKPFYSVEAQLCDRLPDWAIRIIDEDCNSTNKRKFSLPVELRVSQNMDITTEQLNVQAREDFLQAPAQWITRQRYPNLFRPQTSTSPTNTFTPT